MDDLRSRAGTTVLALLAAAVLVAPAAAQQPPTPGAAAPSRLFVPRPLVRVPGTHVAIAPPPGFAPAASFAGFHRPDAGASIVVDEYAIPADTLRAGMTAQALGRRGMRLLSESRAVAGGVLGTLYSVAEEVRGRPYRKWLALFGDRQSAVIISASFPEALAEELALPLKNSLLASAWDPRAEVDLQGGLRFRIEDLPGLRASRRSGNLLLLEDPARATPSPLDPLLVIGEALAERAPAELEAFARERLAAFDRVRDLREVDGRVVEVDGRNGFELTATGDDVYGRGPMLVYQLLVPDGLRYTLAQGVVGIAEEALFLPRFRAVARGLRFVD